MRPANVIGADVYYDVICVNRVNDMTSGGFRGGRAGRAPPPPPKIRKAYVIQR